MLRGVVHALKVNFIIILSFLEVYWQSLMTILNRIHISKYRFSVER
jgi:hypothetical protein